MTHYRPTSSSVPGRQFRHIFDVFEKNIVNDTGRPTPEILNTLFLTCTCYTDICRCMLGSKLWLAE